MEGVLMQSMLTGGVEVIIGVTDDPLFGPLIAFGFGGIHVEIFSDVQFRIMPLTDRDAAEMVRGIKAYRLLTGYRGHPPSDLEALEETLLRCLALPPGQGCRIVDAQIRAITRASQRPR